MRPWVLSMSTDRKGKACPLLFWRVVSKLSLRRGMPPYLLPTLATTLFWLLSSVHLFPLSDITEDKAWRRPGWSPILFCFSSAPSKFWPFLGGFVCLSLKFASRSNALFNWLIESCCTPGSFLCPRDPLSGSGVCHSPWFLHMQICQAVNPPFFLIFREHHCTKVHLKVTVVLFCFGSYFWEGVS